MYLLASLEPKLWNVPNVCLCNVLSQCLNLIALNWVLKVKFNFNSSVADYLGVVTEVSFGLNEILTHPIVELFLLLLGITFAVNYIISVPQFSFDTSILRNIANFSCFLHSLCHALVLHNV